MTYIDKKLEKGATWEMTFGQPLTKKRGAKVRVQRPCNRRVTALWQPCNSCVAALVFGHRSASCGAAKARVWSVGRSAVCALTVWNAVGRRSATQPRTHDVACTRARISSAASVPGAQRVCTRLPCAAGDQAHVVVLLSGFRCSGDGNGRAEA